MAPLIPLVSVDSTLGLALIGFAGSCVLVPYFLFTVDTYYHQFQIIRCTVHPSIYVLQKISLRPRCI